MNAETELIGNIFWNLFSRVYGASNGTMVVDGVEVGPTIELDDCSSSIFAQFSISYTTMVGDGGKVNNI